MILKVIHITDLLRSREVSEKPIQGLEWLPRGIALLDTDDRLSNGIDYYRIYQAVKDDDDCTPIGLWLVVDQSDSDFQFLAGFRDYDDAADFCIFNLVWSDLFHVFRVAKQLVTGKATVEDLEKVIDPRDLTGLK